MGMRVARRGASLPHTDDTLEQKQIAELAIKPTTTDYRLG